MNIFNKNGDGEFGKKCLIHKHFYNNSRFILHHFLKQIFTFIFRHGLTVLMVSLDLVRKANLRNIWNFTTMITSLHQRICCPAEQHLFSVRRVILIIINKRMSKIYVPNFCLRLCSLNPRWIHSQMIIALAN